MDTCWRSANCRFGRLLFPVPVPTLIFLGIFSTVRLHFSLDRQSACSSVFHFVTQSPAKLQGWNLQSLLGAGFIASRGRDKRGSRYLAYLGPLWWINEHINFFGLYVGRFQIKWMHGNSMNESVSLCYEWVSITVWLGLGLFGFVTQSKINI